jgi:hypothetical protein
LSGLRRQADVRAAATRQHDKQSTSSTRKEHTVSTTATIIQTAATPTSQKRSFRRRYSVARGNALQVSGILAGSALLAGATGVHGGPSTALMFAGFVAVYLNCHAIAHYLAGRLVGLRFRGYGVRGTDHPEVYPPGIRQLMQAAPFYVTLSTKESREHAGRWAKAIYFAAGETSTAICSIAYAAVAASANVPGSRPLLIAMVIFNVISTIVTTRNPTGDYAKALRALRN